MIALECEWPQNARLFYWITFEKICNWLFMFVDRFTRQAVPRFATTSSVGETIVLKSFFKFVDFSSFLRKFSTRFAAVDSPEHLIVRTVLTLPLVPYEQFQFRVEVLWIFALHVQRLDAKWDTNHQHVIPSHGFQNSIEISVLLHQEIAVFWLARTVPLMLQSAFSSQSSLPGSTWVL